MTTKAAHPPAVKSVARLLKSKKASDKRFFTKIQAEMTKIADSGDIDHYDMAMHEIKRILDEK